MEGIQGHSGVVRIKGYGKGDDKMGNIYCVHMYQNV